METSTRIVQGKADGKAVAWMGALVRGAGRIAPGSTARWAATRFLTPRRTRPKQEEQAVLETAHHQMMRLGDRSISVYSWGTGPLVLLVHGWGGHGGNMTAFVEPLRQAGYAVAALEAPAHGRSPGRITHVPEMGEVVRHAVEALGVEAIVCHSAGATATGLAMRASTRVERVVMVAPASRPAQWAGSFADALQMQGPLRKRYVEALERHAGASLASIGLDTTACDIRCPVLILHDEDDAMASIHDIARLAGALPNVRRSATRGLGHYRLLRAPEHVSAALAFLQAPLESLHPTAP
jgi:pimeloyl-ACP methyl ester carboxylesterase